MLVYYRPPAGSEPLEVEALGGVAVFLPQDQIWKKISVKHKVRPKQDPIMKDFVRNEAGEIQYHYGTVKRWVVDEEKTALLKAGKLKPPADLYEVSDDLWKHMGIGKFAPMRKRFLPRDQVEGVITKNYDEIMRQGDKKLAEAQALVDAKQRELADQLAAMDAKLAELAKKSEEMSEMESKLAAQGKRK